MTLIDYVTAGFGIGSILLGFYVLVTRINVLRFGEYRVDYVLLHVSLGGGCAAGGWALISGAMPFGVCHLAIAAATISLLHMQRSLGGKQWTPPRSAHSDYSPLMETQPGERHC